MKNLFLLNLLLSLIWCAVTATFTLLNFLFGFALAAAAIYIVFRTTGEDNHLRRPAKIIYLFGLFLYELTLSSIRVLKMAFSPDIQSMKPSIIAYPMKVKEDYQITLLANLITLTPGTLSMDVSDDKSTLYIHAIDMDDKDAMIADIADGFEKTIIETFK
jgi:multicomponent Na+:H+ antiporter subunit E